MFVLQIYKKILDVSKKFPEKIAIYENDKSYSYFEFKKRIEDIQIQLENLQLPPSTRVGLFIPNSFEGYCAVFACALCGLTYVPLQVDDPPFRVLKILELANIKVILTTPEFEEKLQSVCAGLEMKILSLVALAEELADRSLALRASDEIPLYILFTSGSTGLPKGVLIMPQAVENFLSWAFSYFDIDSADIFLAHSRLTFDLSVFNLFLPFMGQASARTVTKKIDQIYPGSLLKKNVTISLFVPRVTGLLIQAGQLKPNDYPSLRHVIFCGEKLFAAQVNSWRQTHSQVSIHNIYGPTETTVTCTSFTVPPGRIATDPVPVGVPIPGMELNFLDSEGKVIGGKNRGELIISGVGVSPNDYIGQTSTRFFDHPTLGRSFRTGDIVERDENGVYNWIGRLDHQIKIRGYRVEISEVETVLTQTPGILEAVCLFDKTIEQLIAFVCLKDPNGEVLEQAKIRIQNMLPDYMRPSEYRVLASLPRNANGKVDRFQLSQNEKIS